MNESDPCDAQLAELLSVTAEVNEDGDVEYRNYAGQLHRVYGPAVTLPSGFTKWYQNGELHRTYGAAIEFAHTNIVKFWYLNGEHLTEKEWYERVKSM